MYDNYIILGPHGIKEFFDVTNVTISVLPFKIILYLEARSVKVLKASLETVLELLKVKNFQSDFLPLQVSGHLRI